MKLPFQTVDVFTAHAFGGNPLAVLTDARGLSSEQMQRVAAEFNLAETTFVLPPQDPVHTARVRIFTPKAELPFAGHPNIGTAFVLARAGTCHGRAVAGDKLVFEEKAGLVAIDLVRDGGEVIATRLAAPQLLTLGEEVAPEIVASATALKASDFVGKPVIASTGVRLLFAEVASRAVLKQAACITDTFVKHLPTERAIGIHLFVALREDGREDGVEVQSRMFAPLYGVPEDPATGGANVTLAGLLALRDPRPDLELSVTIGQGFDMGRPSIMKASADKKAGKVTATYIGGRSVPMMSGTIEV
jgi:trans-2,3-dihydro-3-hydroxyanthranilate isomerase